MPCPLLLLHALLFAAAEAPPEPPETASDAQAEVAPTAPGPVLYTDPSQPVARRVDDLISRMTLREKTSQLLSGAPAIERLNVPAYNYWNEALHGVARAGTATVFPQAIGLAATWDVPLMQTIADTIATEARGKYNDALARNGGTARYYGLTFWTPNINLFRDPRWGRGQETYGEDNFLTSRMAVAFIRGLQGDNPHYIKTLACAKHYAVHSGPESTRHTADVSPSEVDFYDSYLPHFEAAVREAKVGSVMGAYNRVYGESASASQKLLVDLLRTQWGFTGHVVSDCDSVKDIWQTHKIVATQEEAVALALKTGCDLNCNSQYSALVGAFEAGLVTSEDIDNGLRRVLRARFDLGMFDPPEMVPFSKLSLSDVDTPANDALALKAARESVVLLKNSGVLPLDRGKIKRLAVIGPNADSVPVLMGNYNGTASHPVTMLAGLRVAAGDDIEVTYTLGCPVAEGADASSAPPRGGRRGGAQASNTNAVPTGPESPEFQRALELAREADAVVFVGGISARLEGEEMNVNLDGFSGGDRTRIELPAVQTELLRALHATGKPVVFVNCSGSAVAFPWEAENLPAIVQAWYPGQAGGTAVADVLFGAFNPSGRLPVTFYRSTEDLPPFEDYSMANRTYRFFTGTPLYAFGHGLSYTSFAYGQPAAVPQQIGPGGFVQITLSLANSGARPGAEVVQVYARQTEGGDAATQRPRLCAFQRVTLEPGAKTAITLTIPAEALRHWSVEKKAYVIEPGVYQFQVGTSSADIRGAAMVRIASR